MADREKLAWKIARDLFGQDAEDNVALIQGDLEEFADAAVVACDSIAAYIGQPDIDRSLLPGETYEFIAEIERKARLDEAKWWEPLVGAVDPDHPEGRSEKCMYCQRIAELGGTNG